MDCLPLKLKSPSSFETSVIPYQPTQRSIRDDWSFKTNETSLRARIFVKASVIYRYLGTLTPNSIKLLTSLYGFHALYIYILLCISKIRTWIKNGVLLTTTNQPTQRIGLHTSRDNSRQSPAINKSYYKSSVRRNIFHSSFLAFPHHVNRRFM